jgi:hypothetical protein
VRKVDEFAFLSSMGKDHSLSAFFTFSCQYTDILGNLDGSTATRDKPKRREPEQDHDREATLLDRFVQNSADAMEKDDSPGNIIMNDDGTMSTS